MMSCISSIHLFCLVYYLSNVTIAMRIQRTGSHNSGGDCIWLCWVCKLCDALVKNDNYSAATHAHTHLSVEIGYGCTVWRNRDNRWGEQQPMNTICGKLHCLVLKRLVARSEADGGNSSQVGEQRYQSKLANLKCDRWHKHSTVNETGSIYYLFRFY